MKENSPIEIPSIEYINQCIRYEGLTGELFWKERPLSHFKNTHGMNTFNSKFANKKCSSRLSSGYKTICLNGKCYLAHRVIWKMYTGNDPKNYIDHKDLDNTNNRFENLREATSSQNKFNTHKPKNNKSGIKGVTWDSARNKWFASCQLNGKTKALGRFKTPELASLAYQSFAKQYHGEFFRKES